jgi:uncharacterized membrane protein
MINLMPKETKHPHRSRHIIRSFEAGASRKRSFPIKLADLLTFHFGTLLFLTVNVIFFGFWIIINLGLIEKFKVFDPFPFVLLITFVSLEAIILSIIVLISQKRESQINSLRQELQLQVNLITEREITKVLKLLKETKEELKKDKIRDEELEEMIKEVDTSYIERKLEEQIKASENPLKILKK